MTRTTHAEAVEEIMELERETYRRFAAGNFEHVMDNMLDEQAIVCPPGIDVVRGRENQRAMFREFLSMDGVSLWWEPIEAHVSPAQEMAWAFGTVRWTLPGQDEVTGKYISVWEKRDGRWLNTVEIRNASA